MDAIEDRLRHIAALFLGKTDKEQLMRIDMESIDYNPKSMCLCFKGWFKYVVGSEPAEFNVKFPIVMFFRKSCTDEEILAWFEKDAE